MPIFIVKTKERQKEKDREKDRTKCAEHCDLGINVKLSSSYQLIGSRHHIVIKDNERLSRLETNHI